MNENKKLLTEEELTKREEALQARLERLTDLEQELLEKERSYQAKESAKKSVLLRLPPSLHAQVAAWAEEDFRSINGQIEYLLTQAVHKHYSK